MLARLIVVIVVIIVVVGNIIIIVGNILLTRISAILDLVRIIELMELF